MFPISRTLIPAFARRRATPSPASTTYNAPLTIRRFDDCARWALGGGPAVVPTVMRRVPAFDGVGLVCAMLSCATTTILMLIRVVNSSDDSFCIYSSMRAGRGTIVRRRDATRARWDVQNGIAHCT